MEALKPFFYKYILRNNRTRTPRQRMLAAVFRDLQLGTVPGVGNIQGIN